MKLSSGLLCTCSFECCCLGVAGSRGESAGGRLRLPVPWFLDSPDGKPPASHGMVWSFHVILRLILFVILAETMLRSVEAPLGFVHEIGDVLMTLPQDTTTTSHRGSEEVVVRQCSLRRNGVPGSFLSIQQFRVPS